MHKKTRQGNTGIYNMQGADRILIFRIGKLNQKSPVLVSISADLVRERSTK